MKLKDLIPNIIGKFENIQLVSAKTGHCITDVTYYEGGSEYNVAEIANHMNSDVLGISSDISDKQRSYIRIMLLCD